MLQDWTPEMYIRSNRMINVAKWPAKDAKTKKNIRVPAYEKFQNPLRYLHTFDAYKEYQSVEELSLHDLAFFSRRYGKPLISALKSFDDLEQYIVQNWESIELPVIDSLEIHLGNILKGIA